MVAPRLDAHARGRMNELLAAWAERWPAWVLAATRMLPMAYVAPWLTMRGFPVSVRVVVAAAVLVATGPLWWDGWKGPDLPATSALPETTVAFLVLWLREAVVGLVIAVAVSLPIWLFSWVGGLVHQVGDDSWRGNPISLWLADRPPLAQLASSAAAAAFFAWGGHLQVWRFLRSTLLRWPIAGGLDDRAKVSTTLALVSEFLAFATAAAAAVGAALVALELSVALAFAHPASEARAALRASLAIALLTGLLLAWQQGSLFLWFAALLARLQS